MFTKSFCPYCVAAKDLLNAKGYSYTDLPVEKNEEKFFAFVEKYSYKTVPMIFIGEEFIGGFNELNTLNEEGKLEQMIS